MAGGGGAWKVAYADFVTAMMAFFMVMWLVGQKEGTKEAVASYFSDPFATGGQEGNHGEARHEIPHRAHGPDKKNSKKPASDERPKQVTLRLQGVGNHTSVAMAILFAPGSAELDHSGEANLEQILPALLGRPQKIELRGHASRRPLPAGSSFADAWALSYARCQAVRNYLETHGIEPDRIRLSQAGTSEAVGNIDDDDYLAKQERVEVRMLTETVQDWQPAEAKHKAAKPKHDDTHAAAPAPAAHGH